MGLGNLGRCINLRSLRWLGRLWLWLATFPSRIRCPRRAKRRFKLLMFYYSKVGIHWSRGLRSTWQLSCEVLWIVDFLSGHPGQGKDTKIAVIKRVSAYILLYAMISCADRSPNIWNSNSRPLRGYKVETTQYLYRTIPSASLDKSLLWLKSGHVPCPPSRWLTSKFWPACHTSHLWPNWMKWYSIRKMFCKYQ